MSNDVKYTTGATNLAGSLGRSAESDLSKGFTDETPETVDALGFFSEKKEDDCGNTSEGDKWAFRRTGAVGRANGTDR